MPKQRNYWWAGAGYVPGRGVAEPCRKLIDDGVIGRPIAATAFMLCHGMRVGIPDPVFLLQGGRRADVRYGAVLYHGAGSPDGACEKGGWYDGKGFE